MSSVLSLDASSAGRRQRWSYLGAAAIIAVASTITLPFASVPLPAIAEFNLFYASIVIVTDLTTAFLLIGQFRASRRLPPLLLGAAYLFTGSIVILHLLYFSEFADSLGVLTGRPQTAAYLWHFWHIGYPLFVLVYVLSEWRSGDALVERFGVGRLIAGVVVTVVGLVALLTALVTVLHDSLPVLHDGRTWNPITYQLGAAMGGLTVAALVALLWVTRGRNVLHLWLALALTAFFFDFTPNLLAGQRFALGWYLGRCEAMLASSILLVMLLTEMNQLYRTAADSLQAVSELNQDLAARMRDLTAVNRELEAFSYSVSHDLRAPLRRVRGFSRALLEDCADRLDDSAKDHLRRIQGATARMDLLIGELLKLSHVARQEVRRVPVDLSALANEVVRELRAAEPERAVEVAVAADLRAVGDPGLLRIALQNLLGNAWKFSGRRERALIEFGVQSNGSGRPVYYVRDNGAGFDMEFGDKLFAPFQRLHRSAEFPGTGIGLATVQRVLHRHGGTIWVESAPDGGATFYFTLSDEKDVLGKDGTRGRRQPRRNRSGETGVRQSQAA